MLTREKVSIQVKRETAEFSDVDSCYIDLLPASVAHLTLESSNGNEYAFTELYRLFTPIIHSLSRRYETICPFDGDDMVQEIFLKLWEKRSQLREIRDFHRYLCLMVKNRLTDQFRRRSCHRSFINNHADQAVATNDHPHLAEIQRVYARAVSALPLRARQAFELQRFLGLRRDEIADVMGLSIHSVRNHLARAQDTVKREVSVYLLN